MDLGGLKKVRKSLEERGLQLTDEARIPCRVLRASREVGYLAPPAWDGFCKRRTSWYGKSDRAGKFLVVSNTPFDHLDMEDPIIITESDFRPPRLPSPDELAQLIKSQEFQNRKPPIWEKVDPLDKEFYQRWYERHRPDEPFDFEKIFSHHSANHANFLDPKFFVKLPAQGTGLPGNELSSHIVPLDPAYKAGAAGHLPANQDGIIVPYSIADSIHVCSSCLEFFNILGNQWPVKYVVPCIGAVQFAHLPVDLYFEVNALNRKAPQG
jgi:hypothetical protein